MNRLEVGDKVKDKFKCPKPGDESQFGVVELIDGDSITIRMETHSPFETGLRTMPLEQFRALFEEVEP